MAGINFEFTMQEAFTNSDLEIFIQVKGFTPSREAPPCSNHDSPAYSDCGDDAEFDDYIASLIIVSSSGRVFFIPLPEELHDVLEIKITEEIFKRGEKHYYENIY